jgi:dihydrolipoamide dehydrogenase
MVVGEFTQECDLLVIGGGPAGYSAAFRAAELGVSVAIVDNRPALGGVCLHEGCIPSKTLLGVSGTIADAERAASFGVTFGKPTIDLALLRGRCSNAVATLARGLDSLAKKFKVERFTGEAVFEDSKHVAIRGGSVPRVKFRKAIIATGAAPLKHALLPIDGQRVITARDVMRLFAGGENSTPLPKSMTVIGAGYQAVEVASICAALCGNVTLLTEDEQLLPNADPDLVRPFVRRLKEILADVRTGATIQSAEKFSREECIVVAIGDRPNTTGLGLEHTQARLDADGAIVVDDAMRTSDPRILAVGDVTGAPMLADKALQQGRIAGEVVAGWNSVFDARAVPFTVFTDPQIAWCGLSEQQAAREQIDVKVVKVPWGASGRAVSLGRSDGMTKLILDPVTKLILGVGLVGANACELIAEACLAVEMGAVAADLAATVHPHPSLSEMLAAAAQQVDEAEPSAQT